MNATTENNERAGRKKVILVAGMHRSGTSAFARFLNLLGPALPGQLIPSVKNNNEFGFWESRPVIAINDRILADRGMDWDGSGTDIRQEVTDQRLVRAEYLAVIRKFLINAGAEKKDLVIKDPRLCRTLGFWLTAVTDIGSDVAVLIPYRHPLEVAASLEKRDGFDTLQSLNIWFEHNLEVERASRGYPRSFISFDALLSDWRGCAEKVARELELALETDNEGARSGIDQFLVAAGKHHSMRAGGDAADGLPAAASALLGALRVLEKDPGSEVASKEVDSLWRSPSRLNAKPAEESQRTDGSILRQQLVSSLVYLDLLRDAQDRADVHVTDSAVDRAGKSEKRAGASVGSPLGRLGRGATEASESDHDLTGETNRELRSELEHARSKLRDVLKFAQSLKKPSLFHRLKCGTEERKRGIHNKEADRGSSMGIIRQLAIKAACHLISLTLLVRYAARARIYRLPRQLIWAIRLRRSGIFDHEFYRQGLPRPHRFANSFTLALHYCVYGDTTRQSPNAYFDAGFYLRFHREAVGRVPAFVHYVSIGQRLDLSPNPVLDASRYVKFYPQASGKVLADFDKYSNDRHSALNPLFDTSWYRLSNPDLEKACVEPFRHFLQFGWKEGRDPHPLFDVRFYLDTYRDVEQAHINPLFHYLVDGYRERRNAHILFDSAFYSAQAGLTPDHDPLMHYVESGWRDDNDPHPLISSEWYISSYPAVEVFDLPPLLHFVEADGEYEFDPGPWFSSRDYHERYPESVSEEPNALLHYLRHGCTSGNTPTAWFNAEAYLKHYEDVAREYSLNQAFGHFIRIGQSEGRDAAPMFQTTETTKARISGDAEIRGVWQEGPGSSEFVTVRKEATANPTFTDVVAWYLPQFHPIPENDRWWGEGFTEWRNVTRGAARFRQHYQPRRPDALGYYDLRVPEVLERQVELAKKYGISAFCFHYYWFGGKQVLDLPLRRLLGDKSLDIGFCVSWANENWTRAWDGLDADVLLEQQYSAEDDIAFIDKILPLFEDSRYLRIDEKPLLIVYRPSLLPDAVATAERWRARCRQKGVGEILIGMVQFEQDNPQVFGFDIAIEFPPHKIGRELNPINDLLDIQEPGFQGTAYSYDDLVDRGRTVGAPHYPLIRGACPSWDNEARRPSKGTTYHGSTPEKYASWLEQCCAFAIQYPVYGRSLVFVNAWNEWAEAAYLEPDRRFGYAYLEATHAAASSSYEHWDGIPTVRKILLVTHDMHNHGAQQLALHITRTLSKHFNYEVAVLSLGPGELLVDFEKCAAVYDFQRFEEERSEKLQLLRQFRAEGYESAIVNTTVAGGLSPMLKEAGLFVSCLVHELPTLISEYGLNAQVAAIEDAADTIVFASDLVRDRFIESAPGAAQKAIVRPQGLYRTPDATVSSDVAREQLVRRHGIPTDAEIVLAVGWGDLRKGIDSFVRVATAACRARPAACFIWVGVETHEVRKWFQHDIEKAGLEDRILLLPRTGDLATFYAAANLYFLPSREDPFPSVVIEAMSNGLPVVAFEKATGAASLIEQSGGLLVPYMDEAAAASGICNMLQDQDELVSLGMRAKQLVIENFGWLDYMHDLLELCGTQEEKVSVVVPNYNYEQHLERRLRSIYEQTHPIYEVIVLDDCSTDQSVATLRSLAEEKGYHFNMVVNDTNSGCVSRQWLKGVSMADCDLVWIAEADDFSDPDFLDHVVAPMQDSADIVMSYCESRQIDSDGLELAPDYRQYVRDISPDKWLRPYVEDGELELSTALAVKNTIPNVSAVVFRRKVLEDVLSRNIDYIAALTNAGDYATYTELLRHGRIAYQPVSLNSHCRGAGSVTLNAIGSTKLIEEIASVQKRVCELVECPPRSRQKAEEYLHALNEQMTDPEAQE